MIEEWVLGLENGTYMNFTEIAQVHCINRAWITRILQLYFECFLSEKTNS